MKGAAAPQGRQRLRDKEGSGGATTKAEPAARQRRQNRRPNDEGRTGGATIATMKGVAARQ
jgi:hypothetical protein